MNEELRQLRIENKLLRENNQAVDAVAVLVEEGWIWDGDQWQRPPELNQESAYQRGYLDGIGRECPHCKDYRAMYIKVRDDLAAEQQLTQRQTARIVDLQTHIANLEGEE